MLGPLLGGLLLKLPVSSYRLRVPFLVAAGPFDDRVALVLLRLPESRPQEGAKTHARVLSWRGITDTLSNGKIGGLVGLGFLSTLAFAALEGTLSKFLWNRMNWSAEKAAYAFAMLGFVSVHQFKAASSGGWFLGLARRD